jgi:hypothetical protein
MSVAPKLTRRELRGLIKRQQWHRLRSRLAAASVEDLAVQLPGLRPQERAAVRALWPTDNSASAGHSARPG